jgi:hypothetical protein
MAQKIIVQDGNITYTASDPTRSVKFDIEGQLNVAANLIVGDNPLTEGTITTSPNQDLLITTGGNGNLKLSPGGSIVLNGVTWPTGTLNVTPGMFLGASSTNVLQFYPFVISFVSSDILSQSQLNTLYPTAQVGQSVVGNTVIYECVAPRIWRTTGGGAGGTGSVTSIDVSGGTTGLTTTGGPVTSVGVITLNGTLATTNGGTGLSSFVTNEIFYAGSTSTVAQSNNFTFDGANNVTIGGASPLTISGSNSTITATGINSDITLGINGTGAVIIGPPGFSGFISSDPGYSLTITGETTLTLESGTGNTTMIIPHGSYVAESDGDLTGVTYATSITTQPTALTNKYYVDNAIANATSGSGPLIINNQLGNYTLQLSDAFNTLIRVTSGILCSVTIPNDSVTNLPIGSAILVSWNGVGQVSIAYSVGVTVDTPYTYNIGSQFGKIAMIKVAANHWEIEGNLQP